MMSVLMMAAAAAQLSAPQPMKPITTRGDYPIRALERGRQGAVLFDVFIDPQGKPLGCKVARIFETDFGALTCRKVQNATFKPGRDSEGKPAYGRVLSMENFFLPDTPADFHYPLSRAPDLSLTVKSSPTLSQPRTVRVAVAIDVGGKVADCALASEAQDLALANTACGQLKRQWTDTPFENPQGVKQGYVRELTVAFVPKPAR